jgi:PHD/YefM family antitoxin component YafN of YafNO toxin-antitoxin module
MVALTMTDARRHFTQIAYDAELSPVFITRPKADTLVLLNARELSSLQETAYLMSSKANRAALSTGLDQINQGKTVRVSLDDL